MTEAAADFIRKRCLGTPTGGSIVVRISRSNQEVAPVTGNIELFCSGDGASSRLRTAGVPGAGK